MVNRKLPRLKVICPNNHEIITRKTTKIQCRQCGQRFNVISKNDTSDLISSPSVSDSLVVNE